MLEVNRRDNSSHSSLQERTRTPPIWPVRNQVGAKDHQRFQASYATILKARMTALKKRERKDERKSTKVDKKQGGGSKKSTAKKT